MDIRTRIPTRRGRRGGGHHRAQCDNVSQRGYSRAGDELGSEDLVEAAAVKVGVNIPGEGGERDNRLASLGPLSGTGVGVADKAARRSRADWDAAKEDLPADRTLARAEGGETDIAVGLKAARKTLRSLDKQPAALPKSLTRASADLETAISTRREVGKRLHKLESAAAQR